MKVGDEFFQAAADAEEGTVQIWHWIITSIREGTVHATQKTDYTWVKRSKTHGDYGWAKSISPWNKRRFRLADGPPKDWARSKAAAYGMALGPVEAAIKKLTKLRAQLTGQRTKARTRALPAKRRASSPSAAGASAGSPATDEPLPPPLEGQAPRGVDGPIRSRYGEALRVVIDNQNASPSIIQRKLQCGYNEAQSYIEQMERDGVVSLAEAANGPAYPPYKRRVLIPPPPISDGAEVE